MMRLGSTQPGSFGSPGGRSTESVGHSAIVAPRRRASSRPRSFVQTVLHCQTIVPAVSIGPARSHMSTHPSAPGSYSVVVGDEVATDVSRETPQGLGCWCLIDQIDTTSTTASAKTTQTTERDDHFTTAPPLMFHVKHAVDPARRTRGRRPRSRRAASSSVPRSPRLARHRVRPSGSS